MEPVEEERPVMKPMKGKCAVKPVEEVRASVPHHVRHGTRLVSELRVH
jgi:hypothetical protein